MDDIDFSFQEQEKQRHRRKLEPPPEIRQGPGWPVSGASEPARPRWSITTDKGITTFMETTPPATGSGFAREVHHRSKFKIRVTNECLVAGTHAPVGSIVVCFHHHAADLISSGNAVVVEEQRNAF